MHERSTRVTETVGAVLLSLFRSPGQPCDGRHVRLDRRRTHDLWCIRFAARPQARLPGRPGAPCRSGALQFVRLDDIRAQDLDDRHPPPRRDSVGRSATLAGDTRHPSGEHMWSSSWRAVQRPQQSTTHAGSWRLDRVFGNQDSGGWSMLPRRKHRGLALRIEGQHVVGILAEAFHPWRSHRHPWHRDARHLRPFL